MEFGQVGKKEVEGLSGKGPGIGTWRECFRMGVGCYKWGVECMELTEMVMGEKLLEQLGSDLVGFAGGAEEVRT